MDLQSQPSWTLKVSHLGLSKLAYTSTPHRREESLNQTLPEFLTHKIVEHNKAIDLSHQFEDNLLVDNR